MKKITKTLFYTLFTLLLIGVVYSAFNYHSNIPVEELKKKYAYDDSHFVEVVGMDVHYRITGNGQPLVLLHGTGASLHTWEKWTEQLSSDFKVISVDLPGFGLTGNHYSNNYSIKAYTDFLHAFLKKINVREFSLAGNSLGGQIAWEYALDYPDEVEKLILIDPAGYPMPEKDPPLAFRLASNPLLGKIMLRVTPRSLFTKSLTDVYENDQLVTDELIERYFEIFLRRGNRQAFIDRMNQPKVDRSADIKNINTPTLILWGAKDNWIPVSLASKYKEEIPAAQLIVYDNAGHVPMEEIPEQTAKDTYKFLMNTFAEPLVTGN